MMKNNKIYVTGQYMPYGLMLAHKLAERLDTLRKEEILLYLRPDGKTQATIELSGRRSINNRSFRNWNKSIYQYNLKNKTYFLKKDVVVTRDVPKKVIWK